MRILLYTLIILFVMNACHGGGNDPVAFVDPFIGTGADGHTFPGAVYPFGMIQLSPDTHITGPDYATGYHYSDSSILGFSHTRYSGTGRGAGGDILFMPLNSHVQWDPGSREDPSSGYRSAFSHTEEVASPGYYRVHLKDDDITAELTAGKRTGVHRYTWHRSDTAGILIDLVHGIHDRPDSLFLHITGPGTIEGFRKSLGGLRNFQTVWFAAEFSEPFDQHLIFTGGRVSDTLLSASGKEVKAFFRFYNKKKIEVKVALSRVDMAGARGNLQILRGKDFEDIRRAARRAWNRELGKIEIVTREPLLDTLFYTALYHSCILPTLDTDRDGRYRSPNHEVYQAKGYTNYTNFSLWDTFRGLHPLFTIINRKMTRDFLMTFLQRYQHTGSLPVFELSGNDLPVMIGFHSLPVIADAWAKGIRAGDSLKMLEAMKALTRLPYGTRTTDTVFGYLPYDYTYQSVSRTLEYAYDDWCVARVARDLDEESYHRFRRRANFYRDLYDAASGFMRPRDSRHRWLEDFDPLAYTRNYTQGNAWQYTTFVPHDIAGLIGLMGGDRAFGQWLDRFFTTENPRTYQGRRSSLMIGQYYHGNEPSHHVAYLYNFAGQPWKTQAMVRRIMETQYRRGPAGLAGNDDAGQMSAWYVLSALGFYSVTPGMNSYVLGSPRFDQAEIRLENGKTFRIIAENNSKENVYIRSVTLNGQPYTHTFLKQEDIMRGGTLRFIMGPHPDTTWGTARDDRPPSDTYRDVPAPEISITGRRTAPDGIVPFGKHCQVTLSCADTLARLFYTLDGTRPDTLARPYTGPFRVDRSVVLQARGFREGRLPGYVSSLTLRRLDPLPAVQVARPRPGITYTYREVWVCREIRQMYQYPVLKKGVIPATGTEMGFRMDEKNGTEFRGYLKIPRTGTYTFYLFSEDGSILYLDDTCLIINEGTHRQTEIALEKGFHKILLKHVQVGGTPRLRLEWSGPGIPKQTIPTEVYFH